MPKWHRKLVMKLVIGVRIGKKNTNMESKNGYYQIDQIIVRLDK